MSKTHSNDHAPRSAVHFGFQILTTVAVIVAVALPLGCGDGSPSNPSPSSAALETNTTLEFVSVKNPQGNKPRTGGVTPCPRFS